MTYFDIIIIDFCTFCAMGGYIKQILNKMILTGAVKERGMYESREKEKKVAEDKCVDAYAGDAVQSCDGAGGEGGSGERY